jgi:lipopolysaccharide O-acetyltransferase
MSETATRTESRWAGSARRAGGRGAVGLYRTVVRVRDKLFSGMSSGAFAGFGAHTVLQLPIRLDGEPRIQIGSNVFIGAGSWLQAIDVDPDRPSHEVAIRIGDGVSIAGGIVLSAVSSLTIGDKATFARNVYIADHTHAYDDPSVPILEQGITGVRPVVIGEGAWLGENVVVLPGITIGRNAVVSANSVVAKDIPEYSLAIGVPARVVRKFAPKGDGDAVED